MRVILSFLLLLLTFLLSTPTTASAADWQAVVKMLKASAVEVASSVGSCTGWVTDNERDFVLTAAHCDGDKDSMYADRLKAEVKSKDVKADLMILYVKDIDRPALKLANDDPEVGMEIASYGWGYALEQPLFRVAHISGENIALERSHYIAIDAAFVGGQSGGPVVNSLGEVVMVVQLGNEMSGFGVGAETVEDKMGRFFSKK